MLTGIDVSLWQGAIDWDKAAEQARFAFVRAGQNKGIDPQFVTNWQQSSGKLPRGAYWFYDWRSGKASPEEQGRLFASLLQEDGGELAPVMDFENPYSGWSDTALPNGAAALEIMERFRAAVGVETMFLYTNASTLKYWGTGTPANWLLWIAAYPLWERTAGNWDKCRSASEIPNGWTPDTSGWPYTFWQFTDKLDGELYGVSSKDLDGNVFGGDEADLATLCGWTPPEPTPIEPTPTPEPSEVAEQLAGLAADIAAIRNIL